LFGNSAVHKDVFEYNLGLANGDMLDTYISKPAISSGGTSKSMGLEFFSMLQTHKDVRVEYEGSQELKRLRQGYVMHVLDYVIQDRNRVFKNDMKALEERDKDRVTVRNVFEIASKNGNKKGEMRKLDQIEAQ